MTILFSLLTIFISLATFSIAFSQMKIASAKNRLDLYNKRFNIYVTALEYFQACWHKSHKEIEEKSFEITHAYREARFLFAMEDGIYTTLGKIQQNGSTILAFEKHKYERENNLTNDRLHLETLHENACNARLDFQKNLEALESQMERYIQFKEISGWSIFK